MNSFTRRLVEQDPPDPIAFVVVARLTDGQGQIPLELVIARLDTLEEISQHQAIAVFNNPLQILRFVLPFQAYPFPQLGACEVALVADGEPIARH